MSEPIGWVLKVVFFIHTLTVGIVHKKEPAMDAKIVSFDLRLCDVVLCRVSGLCDIILCK